MQGTKDDQNEATQIKLEAWKGGLKSHAGAENLRRQPLEFEQVSENKLFITNFTACNTTFFIIEGTQ